MKKVGPHRGWSGQGCFLEEGALERGLVFSSDSSLPPLISMGTSLFGFSFLAHFLATLGLAWWGHAWNMAVAPGVRGCAPREFSSWADRAQVPAVMDLT